MSQVGSEARDAEVDRQALREHVRSTLTRLSRTGELPALPAAATAALAIARDPEAGVESLCTVIRTDVGLSARILRAANSAAYARRVPARTLAEAVLTLGSVAHGPRRAGVRQLFHRAALRGQCGTTRRDGARREEVPRHGSRRPASRVPPAFPRRRPHRVSARGRDVRRRRRAVDSGPRSGPTRSCARYGFDHAEAGAILAETGARARAGRRDPLASPAGAG